MIDLNKIKLNNAGEKMDEMGCCDPIKSDKKIYYPHDYIDDEEIPEVKNLNVGDEVIIISKGVVTSKTVSSDEENSNETEVCVEVRQKGIVKTGIEDTKTALAVDMINSQKANS